GAGEPGAWLCAVPVCTSDRGNFVRPLFITKPAFKAGLRAVLSCSLVSAAMLGVTTTAQAGVALSGGMLYGDVGSCYINIEGTGSAYAGGCHYDKQDTITGQHVSIKA